MDFTNLKEGKGYVTRDEIHVRLYRFDLPEDEAFFMRQSEDHPLFSDFGATYKGSDLLFFQVFTGNRDLYYLIRDWFVDAVKELDLPSKVEEWNQDEYHGSTTLSSDT